MFCFLSFFSHFPFEKLLLRPVLCSTFCVRFDSLCVLLIRLLWFIQSTHIRVYLYKKNPHPLYTPSFVDEMRTITASPKSNLSFKEKVALQGKPRLGEIRKVQIRIKESKEFKVSKKFVVVVLI